MNETELRARIAQLESENAQIKAENDSTRNDIILIGEKLVPIFKILELDKMFKPGMKNNVFLIMTKVCTKLLTHYSQVEALINNEQKFLQQIINLFLIKYGPDIQKRRTELNERFIQRTNQRSIGTGEPEQRRAIG